MQNYYISVYIKITDLIFRAKMYIKISIGITFKFNML
jgi:hypothetical protein